MLAPAGIRPPHLWHWHKLAKVFSGKVVHVSDGGGREREPALLSGYISVEFEVYAVWKGPAYATMFVETAWWSGSCGVEFYLGQEWLVYSYDGVTAHPCSRTRPLGLAQADIDELGEGLVPVPGTIEPYQQSGHRIERTRSPAAVADAPTPRGKPFVGFHSRVAELRTPHSCGGSSAGLGAAWDQPEGLGQSLR